MRIPLFVFVLLAVCILAACAANESPKKGEIYQTISVDLDKDGQKEKVCLRAFAVGEEGYYGQLLVMDAKGKMLFEGPEVKDDSTFPAFCTGDFGISRMDVAGDIDGDGSIELVSPALQSDVRPVTHRVLRWKGSRFVPVRAKTLLETSRGSRVLAWSDSTGTWPSKRCWVQRLTAVTKPGEVTAELWRANGKTEIGKAVLSSRAGGYRVMKWLTKLTPQQW